MRTDSEDLMEDGSGWFADPEVEGQERYFDGSEWTSETRDADGDAPLLHMPEHLPELQRAFAAATADIDEVEARLGKLFDRQEAAESGGGAKGRKKPAPTPAAAPAPESESRGESESLGEGRPPSDSSPPVADTPPRAEADGEIDDDALSELDEALANEEPEKLKGGLFRRRP